MSVSRRLPLLFGLLLGLSLAPAAFGDAAVPEDESVRWTFSIDASGAGYTEVVPLDEIDEDVDDPDGEAMTLRSLPTATVRKRPDGTVRIVQPIETAADVSGLLQYDGKPRTGRSGVLLRSERPPAKMSASQVVSLPLRYRLRLPLKLSVDVRRCDLEHLELYVRQVRPDGQQLLLAKLSNPNFISIAHFDNGKDLRRPTRTQLLKPQQYGPDTGTEQVFDLPDRFNDAPLFLTLTASSYSKGGQPGLIVLDRVAIEGQIVPMFGMAMQEFGGRVGIDRVVAGSPAKSAGVQAGDLLISVDGQNVDSVPAAMAKLADIAFGESATLAIERKGERVELVVPTVD